METHYQVLPESKFMDDYTGSGMTREDAIRYVLRVLQHPIYVLTIPMREKAIQQASEHEITAIDLLNAARHDAHNR